MSCAAATAWLCTVILWGCGFIASKLRLQDSPPRTLLAMRFGRYLIMRSMVAIVEVLLAMRTPRVLPVAL